MSIKEKFKLIKDIERRNSGYFYPGLREAEKQRSAATANEEPDWCSSAPNYNKFKGWAPEEVLVWLNIDQEDDYGYDEIHWNRFPRQTRLRG